MAIRDWINKLLAPKQGSVQAGTGYTRPVTQPMEMYDRLAQRNDRKTRITESVQMKETDPRVARILYKMGADATVGDFHVKVESASDERTAKEAQGIIDTLIQKCDIYYKTPGWMRACLREGDLFLENIVDEKNNEVVRLKKLATMITHSNMNNEGNFPENEPAYYQSNPWLEDEKIRTFEEWQVLHIKWEEEDGKPYGAPLLASSRLSWKRLDNGEKNIVARRGINAGLRRHHKIGNPERPDWQQVDSYKKENRDTLDNPMSPVQDFYSTGNVDIIELGGDTTLGDLADLDHFEGMIAMNAGVPMALLGGNREKGINRDVLEEQEEDYYRVIEDLDMVFERAFIKLFRFALLLQGINDESISITFNWGAKDREDIESKIERATKLQGLGFSFETVFGVCDLDGITFEDEMERIKNQIAEGIVPYGLGTKLDPTLASLLMGLGVKQGGNPELIAEEIGKLRELAERQMGPGDMPLKVMRK